jgi:hypothetical protein
MGRPNRTIVVFIFLIRIVIIILLWYSILLNTDYQRFTEMWSTKGSTKFGNEVYNPALVVVHNFRRTGAGEGWTHRRLFQERVIAGVKYT